MSLRGYALCSECAHCGCCEGLPHCGGSKFRPAHVQCAKCGEWKWYDEVGTDGICDECFAEMEEEDGEEGDDGNS